MIFMITIRIDVRRNISWNFPLFEVYYKHSIVICIKLSKSVNSGRPEKINNIPFSSLRYIFRETIDKVNFLFGFVDIEPFSLLEWCITYLVVMLKLTWNNFDCRWVLQWRFCWRVKLVYPCRRHTVKWDRWFV